MKLPKCVEEYRVREYNKWTYHYIAFAERISSVWPATSFQVEKGSSTIFTMRNGVY